MSLSTFSQFYYGHTVTNLNGSIDFDEGAGELQATLNPGDYTLEEYADEIKRAMDAVGDNVYTVVVDRETGILTISADDLFTLRTNTGTRAGSAAWSMMGFSTASNYTGDDEYEGASRSGSVYRPQSILVDHIASENFVEKTDAVVNQSASGRVQVVQFGTTNFIEFTIRLSNDYKQSACQPQIETQTNGVANLRTFMNYIVTKAKFEFMPDRDDANDFEKVILEQTPQSRSGTSFTLEEFKSAPGYFTTGKLRLRVVV